MHVVVSCHINILIFLNFCVFNFQIFNNSAMFEFEIVSNYINFSSSNQSSYFNYYNLDLETNSLEIISLTELINDKKGKGGKFTFNTLYTINMQITIYNQITFAAFPQGSVVDTSSPDLNL